MTVDLKHSQDLLKRLKASVFPIWFYFAVIAGKHFSKPGTKKLLAFRAGNQWVMYENFIFLGSKITVGSDHSHEIKRGLLLGRKAMTNLDSILKNRDITLPTKVRLVKAMVFPMSCMDVRVAL